MKDFFDFTNKIIAIYSTDFLMGKILANAELEIGQSTWQVGRLSSKPLIAGCYVFSSSGSFPCNFCYTIFCISL